MLVKVEASISAFCPKLTGRLSQIMTPRKESVVGLTQGWAPGGASNLHCSHVLRWVRSQSLSSVSSLSLRASISLHCLKRDLAAEWSSEGRYAWTALVQPGGRWMSRLPHDAPVCLQANSGVLAPKNTAYKPGPGAVGRDRHPQQHWPFPG